MARREFRLPSLGENTTEVLIATWHAEPGAHVAAGQPLCDVTSDKADVTLDAPEELWLVEIVAPQDQPLAPGALLAVYDTDPPSLRSGAIYREPAAVPAARPPARTPAAAAVTEFTRAFSGAEWEPVAGYCRALRAGPLIVVSGTAPVAPGGGTHAPGDAYAQARRCLEIIDRALADLGASRVAIIRTRMFVTDIARFAEFARAHGEFFRGHPPTTTMVEVRRLIAPDMLIEIEADAWAPPR